jgi:alkane 1-monooxygenase
MHKSTIRKVIGTIHMLKTLNMHFTYEHLYGHHRKVATPEDPASAQKNDNVYLFFVKSHFGSYKSVYLMEK